MIWKFITFFVRKLDPEIAHKITIKFLKLGFHPRLNKIGIPISIGNLIFKNFIGVAAGFDKNSEVINKIHFLNFGFTEVGTITPLPQYGNPKPRIFRLEKDQALINRLGFNNHGSEIISKRISENSPNGFLGINIGPNKDTKNIILC